MQCGKEDRNEAGGQWSVLKISWFFFLVIMISIIIWNASGMWYCRKAIWKVLASNSDKTQGF